MAYKTSRNLEHLTTTPTSEYRAQQRKKAEEIFSWFKNKRGNREDYLSDPIALKEALDEYETIQDWTWWNGSWSDFWVIWAESFYYRLQTCLHSEDQDILAKSNQADNFAIHLQNEILFFELKLARIPLEKQAEFLSNPLLQPYHHFLEKQFASSKHLLSQEWEKVMNLFSKTSYENRESMTSKFLSKSQKEIELPSWKKQATLEELLTCTCDKDASVRKQAIQAVNEIHLEAKEMAENEINSILEYKKTVGNFISAIKDENIQYGFIVEIDNTKGVFLVKMNEKLFSDLQNEKNKKTSLYFSIVNNIFSVALYELEKFTKDEVEIHDNFKQFATQIKQKGFKMWGDENFSQSQISSAFVPFKFDV